MGDLRSFGNSRPEPFGLPTPPLGETSAKASGFRVVEQVSDLRATVAEWKRTGLLVAFVPTMGALHEGHLTLVRQARLRADKVVTSIFVNPTQFGPGEDLDRYPRTPDVDQRRLEKVGCDLLFLPDVETIYPTGAVTSVEIQGPPGGGLEAEHRPGHFAGVATVVSLLFNLVQPDLAFFGEKDAQQLAVVRRLVRDLHLPVQIHSVPTVREPDGLALSSRNAFLSLDERKAATTLRRALLAAEKVIEGGERRADAVRGILLDTLRAEPLISQIDYAEVVDQDTLLPVDQVEGRIVLPLAVHIGATRLIDNLSLSVLPGAQGAGQVSKAGTPTQIRTKSKPEEG